MINRDEEIKCLLAAITHCKDGTPDHTTRIVRDISWIDWVAQMANAMAAEWVVAKHLDYDYQPGITWDKSRADVGEHIEVKWSVNPSSALWIQVSEGWHKQEKTNEQTIFQQRGVSHYLQRCQTSVILKSALN